jgi:hypothetical protein
MARWEDAATRYAELSSRTSRSADLNLKTIRQEVAESQARLIFAFRRVGCVRAPGGPREERLEPPHPRDEHLRDADRGHEQGQASLWWAAKLLTTLRTSDRTAANTRLQTSGCAT